MMMKQMIDHYSCFFDWFFPLNPADERAPVALS